MSQLVSIVAILTPVEGKADAVSTSYELGHVNAAEFRSLAMSR